MISSCLKTFYNIFDICDTPQNIDLKKNGHLYEITNDLITNTADQMQKIEEHRADPTKFENCLVAPLPLSATIYEVKDLPKWLLRPASRMCVSNSKIQNVWGPKSSNVLRVVMNRRLQKICTEYNLDIVIPKEYFVKVTYKPRSDAYKNYAIASEKLDILSRQEMVEVINNWPANKQRATAEAVCKLIYYSGMMDNHLDNIVLTRDEKIAIVDTEGHGLIKAKGEDYSTISLTKARIVGLNEFSKHIGTLPKVFSQTSLRYLLWAHVRRITKYATVVMTLATCYYRPTVAVSLLATGVVYSIFQSLRKPQPKEAMAQLS